MDASSATTVKVETVWMHSRLYGSQMHQARGNTAEEDNHIRCPSHVFILEKHGKYPHTGNNAIKVMNENTLRSLVIIYSAPIK